MALFLLIVLVAVALGIIGAVVHGLLWLLVIGIIVFLLDLAGFWAWLRGRSRRVHR